MPGIIVARGNKCVDNLAGIAAVVTGRAMDWADIMNAIRETRPEKNVSNNYHHSVGLNRLQECQVQKKGGGGRQKHFGGSQRRLVNQYKVGVVSLYMLRYIVRRKFERFWTDDLSSVRMIL